MSGAIKALFSKRGKSVIFKILVVYMLTAALPLIIIAAIYLRYDSERDNNRFIQQNSQLLLQAKKQLDLLLTNATVVAQTISNMPTLTSIIENTDSVAEMVTTLQYDILPILQTAQSLQDSSSVQLLHKAKHISNVYDCVIYDEEAFSPDENASVLASTVQSKITITKKKAYFPEITEETPLVLRVSRDIRPSYRMSPIGVVQVSFPLDGAMKRIFSQSYPTDSYFYLLSNGSRLWCSEGAPETTETGKHDRITIAGKPYAILTTSGEDAGYMLAACIPLSRKAIGNSYVTGYTVAFILVSLAFTGIVVSLFILKKLKKVTTAMQKFSRGEFNFRLDGMGSDEIGALAATYNDMAEKIETLLTQIKHARKAEKEAIYKSLINQISPHFLNNALDAVRMSAAENSPAISKHLERIIHYLNYNIGNINTFVSLEEELLTLTDYIAIYNLSKEANIEFQLLFEDEVKTSLSLIKIPKFTLQPIVENSLRHGFPATSKTRRIFVMLDFGDDTINISVEDNGCGIPKERLFEVQRSLETGKALSSKDKHSSIGIVNVLQRLRLYCGGNTGLFIESFADVGTIVTVTIPKAPPDDKRLQIKEDDDV